MDSLFHPDIYTHFSHMAGDASKDRLLTSEIAELQARVQALLRDNHELRQELSKVAGVNPGKFRSGHKVNLICCNLPLMRVKNKSLMVSHCICMEIEMLT